MQTALCGICKNHNITTRCSREHIIKVHNIFTDSVPEISSKITGFINKGKNKRGRDPKERKTIPQKEKRWWSMLTT